MKAFLKENTGIIILLYTACTLRFVFIQDLEFGYDELSAIFRAQQDHWQNHIQHGIMPDGHPPLVQTLLWIWLRFFNEDPQIFKGFAAILSLISVTLIYGAGKKLFGQTAGLIAAAFIAFGYLPIVWSLQIRPYVFGMLFSSALLWIWSYRISNNSPNKKPNMAFVLWLTLAAYTHYFCGLFAFLVWVSLFITKPEMRKKLWMESIIAVALFLPALSIFFAQLGNAGLDWLGKPNLHFLSEHVLLLFNHSPVLAAIIAIFLALAVYYIRYHKIAFSKNTCIHLFCLFAIPIAIGFAWSWFKKPVLQHTVLLFSAPALILLIGGLLGAVIDQFRIKFFQYFSLFVIGVLFIFPLLQNQLLQRAITDGYAAATKNLYKTGCAIGMYTQLYADGPKDIIDYHWKGVDGKHSCESFTYLQTNSRPNFYKTLQTIYGQDQISVLVNSGSDPMLIPLLEQHYGNPTGRNSFVGAEVFTFSAKTNKKAQIFPHTFYLKSQPISIPFKALGYQKNDVVVIQFIPSDTANVKGEIQSNILQEKHSIDWRSTNMDEQKGLANNEYYHCIKIADIPKIGPNSRLECKVLDGEKYVAGVLKIRISAGNPWLYSPF